MLKRRYVFLILAVFLLAFPVLLAQSTKPNFSGTWKKDNAHSTPARPGEVTMRIEHHDPELIVNLTITRPSAPEQHVQQRYTTDGKESVSTGADGDSYHTKVVWRDGALVFTIVEHEDDNLINSLEVWSVSPDGGTLTRVRRGESGEQTIVYVRQR